MNDYFYCLTYLVGSYAIRTQRAIDAERVCILLSYIEEDENQ